MLGQNHQNELGSRHLDAFFCLIGESTKWIVACSSICLFNNSRCLRVVIVIPSLEYPMWFIYSIGIINGFFGICVWFIYDIGIIKSVFWFIYGIGIIKSVFWYLCVVYI